MNRPMYLATAVAVLSALGLAACGNGTENGTGSAAADADDDTGGRQPVELSMAVDTNPGDPLSDTLVYFVEELEERSGGLITADAHYGGAIGDEVATIEMLRSGDLDLVVIGADISTLEPTYGVLELPFLFAERERAREFLDSEFGREMSDRLEESTGIRVLAHGEQGFRHITNNTRPIVTPEDLAGITLRVPEVPFRIEMFRTLGAVPTPMSFGEIYLALDQGTIDGQENPLAVIESASFHEVQDYLSLSGHVYAATSLAMNADSYGELSTELQQVVDEAAAAAAARSRAATEEREEATLTTIAESGIEVNDIDIAAFQEAARDMWPSMAESIPDDFGMRVLEAYDVGA